MSEEKLHFSVKKRGHNFTVSRIIQEPLKLQIYCDDKPIFSMSMTEDMAINNEIFRRPAEAEKVFDVIENKHFGGMEEAFFQLATDVFKGFIESEMENQIAEKHNEQNTEK